MYSAIYPVCKINYPKTYLYRCEHLQKNFAYKKKALYIVYKKQNLKDLYIARQKTYQTTETLETMVPSGLANINATQKFVAVIADNPNQNQPTLV